MGSLLINVAFAATLISSIAYFTAYFSRPKAISFARLFFHAAVIFTISSTAYLLYLIITHQFQYTYVWNYSSKDLPLNLLISTFYAGQEGSFHLWAFFMAALGIFLLSFTSKRDAESKDKYEPAVMGIYALIQAFVLFILVIKSPYLFVWESFPKEVEVGFMPQDGRGLNPLLQNFWMTIHPPILFIGFTSLAVPFCFAVASLIKNEYNRWIKLALPWTLFGSLSLGAGIMLGGYWAYGILGWGGYWGWDPVENSSLVPWITIIAAIHTMILQERTGKYKKTSLFLCVISYILVLYSTFLTRSGLLGDASVHSFVDPGQEVYLFLIVFLSLFGLTSLGLIIYRLKQLKREKPQESELLSRETALLIGALTLSASALIISVGTSLPIFSKSTIEPEFYNRMNLPLAILIALINGLGILLKWKHSDGKTFVKKLYLPVGLTLMFILIAMAFGLNDLLIALFAAASLFAFFVNAETAYKILVKTKMKAGPYVAHIGVMLLFIGIIGSSRYSEEVNLSLPLNETKEAIGYKFTYKGATPIKGDEEKYHFNVVVEKDAKAFLLQPVMFYSTYNEQIWKNPDIANLVTKDLYLSPMSLEVPEEFSHEDLIELKKGEEKSIKDFKVKFIDFDKSRMDHDAAMQQDMNNVMAAELEVTSNGKTEKIITEQKILYGSIEKVPVKLQSNKNFTFYLTKINISGETSVEIAVADDSKAKNNEAPETLVLTASIKPLINLVWAGTIIMMVGFFFSVQNRYRLLKSEHKNNQTSTNGKELHHSKGEAHHSKEHTHAQTE